ncbi:MAG TPA: TonB-dependent receptor plug domain-containing protein, partial [Rhizomicrobium sp.]|nr:TonB-dependent receptor plug domain-containing protein [Rhizomicrobium sp.]
MFQSKLKLSNIRSALLLGAASAAALGLTAPAKADSVETVVVTGSRIPQQGLYSSSPVTTVGQQEIQLEGTTSVETLISNLPSAVTDQNNFQANGATGIATVNLRSLGANRTLVLIDGKRLLPGDPIDPVPDLNNIPAALVDHVEVLTGG